MHAEPAARWAQPPDSQASGLLRAWVDGAGGAGAHDGHVILVHDLVAYRRGEEVDVVLVPLLDVVVRYDRARRRSSRIRGGGVAQLRGGEVLGLCGRQQRRHRRGYGE